jgi:hypothetical protein
VGGVGGLHLFGEGIGWSGVWRIEGGGGATSCFGAALKLWLQDARDETLLSGCKPECKTNCSDAFLRGQVAIWDCIRRAYKVRG